MLAHSVSKYVSRFSVAVGKNIILSTSNNKTYEDAKILLENGLKVTILDTRLSKFSFQKNIIDLGGEVIRGVVPINCLGNKQLAGVEISNISEDMKIHGNKRQVGCEILGISGGFSPLLNLHSQRGVKPKWNDNIKSFIPGTTEEKIFALGSVSGIFDHNYILENTNLFVDEILSGKKSSTSNNFQNFEKLKTIFEVKFSKNSRKSFVDLQHDVTTDDIRQSVDEGFKSVEHMKRYTTLGMAIDQGRIGNVIGIGILADKLNLNVKDTGTTTFRPPFVPISIGAFAGRYVDIEWAPIRRTPMHDLHLRDGAIMTDAGDWKRPLVLSEI